jgi:hypothetical protein
MAQPLMLLLMMMMMMMMNVRMHGYFLKPEEVHKHKSLGNTALGCYRRNRLQSV